jgi:signal transduction histidine kinase
MTRQVHELGQEKYGAKFMKELYQRNKMHQKIKKSEELLQIPNVELQVAREQAEESDKMKTAFIQNISHEIRTQQ